MSGFKGPDWYNEFDIDKMHMLAKCHEGDIKAVKEFILKGVQVDEFDDDRVTALQITASKGHLALTEYLLSLDADIERCNVVGFTPLLHACREGHIEIVKLLIQRGAKLDVTTFTGASPLTLACAGGHLELVKYLLNFKDVVDINPKKHDISPSPLMTAAFKNQTVIASCLVSRGARVDYVMPQFSLDILSCVIMCSSVSMFRTLLDLGAKPEAIRNYKNTNIDDLVNICGRLDIWKSLRDYRNQTPDNPKTVDIKTIIKEGKIVEIIDLLQHQEKWTKLDNNQTPLMYAVIYGQKEILSAIIESKTIDINAQESKLSLTALMIAIILSDNEIIMTLLRANARVDIKCDINWTALDFAYRAGDINTKVIEMLHKRLVNRPILSKKAELKQISLLSSSSSTSSLSSTTSQQNDSLTLLPFNKSKKIATTNLPFLKLLLTRLWDFDDPIEYNKRDNTLSSIDINLFDFHNITEPFLTGNDILHGLNKTKLLNNNDNNDDIMLIIINIVKSWYKNGYLMKPFTVGIPINGDYDRIYNNIEFEHYPEDIRFDGNYNMGQKNCSYLKKLKMLNNYYNNINDMNNTSSLNSLSSTYSNDKIYIKNNNLNQKILSSSTSIINNNNSNNHNYISTTQYNNPSLFIHLRSSSYQNTTTNNEKYQYLKETSSPRISPQRLYQKINDLDSIHQRLKSIGLQHYSKCFKEQEVDFQTFLKCDSSDIHQIIQNSANYNPSDVTIIMNLIAELKRTYHSGTIPKSHSKP